jgi:hypothetical protein
MHASGPEPDAGGGGKRAEPRALGCVRAASRAGLERGLKRASRVFALGFWRHNVGSVMELPLPFFSPQTGRHRRRVGGDRSAEARSCSAPLSLATTAVTRTPARLNDPG